MGISHGAACRAAVSCVMAEGDDKILVESVVDDVVEALTQVAAQRDLSDSRLKRMLSTHCGHCRILTRDAPVANDPERT